MSDAPKPIRQTLEIRSTGFVGALVEEREGVQWIFLHRRPGQRDFDRVPRWRPVRPGDEVVAYQIDPDRAADLERANAEYSAVWYAHAGVRAEQSPWPDERRAISTWFPERDAWVLDACCGSGRVTPTLVRTGNRVIGLDFAGPPLLAARGDAPEGVDYVRGDVRALPFADGTFAAVACLENSLGEFLVDPLAVVAGLVRVCKDGGRVVVGLREGEDPWLSWSPQGFVHVARTFERERREELLQAARTYIPRVREVTLQQGEERPWGGVVWHACLDVG